MSKGRFPFVLLLVALLTYSKVPASATPKIEVEDKVFNFKEMIEGQTIEHIYKVQNKGDQPLEIQQVKPG